MGTKTLLHLNYLNRIFILVNQENYDDYSLHEKVGNRIERKVFKELDGSAKERLAAYLITIERYYLHVEAKESKKSISEIQWDESYLQLVQFIDNLIPGYSYRLAYLERTEHQKAEEKWLSTYTVQVINNNQRKEKLPAFRLIHEENTQRIEWLMEEENLVQHYPYFQREFQQIKEDELLAYTNEMSSDTPKLFEGFDDLLD